MRRCPRLSLKAVASFALVAMAAAVLSGVDVTKIPLEEVSNQCDPIMQILACVKSGATGLVAAADKIDEIAIDRGLCRVMKIDPRVVGVDICNRGGSGVNTLEVALLASDIVEDGWSWGMVSHATCIEERPGASVLQRV